MMSKQIAIGVTAVLAVLLASPLSFAKDQDHDKADRVYEKYKEREQNQRQEKRRQSSSRSQSSRAESSQDRNTSRERDRRATDTAKSRERSNERTVYDRSESRSRDSSSSQDTRYRSSAREERSSRQAGEQLSREIRDLLNRKSQTRQSTDRGTRSYSNERPVRSYSESSDSSVREAVSLDQAVNIVRRQSDGKVISARSEGSGSSRKHRIKVLIGERRVRTYVVSATTGKVY